MNTVPYGLKLHRSVRNAPCSKYNQLRKWRQLTFSPSGQPHLQELHASSYMHAANFSHSLRNIALGHHTLLVFVHTSHSTSFFLPLPSFAASFPLDREICSDWKGEKRCNIHSHDILWEYSPSMTTVLLARKVILHYKRCPGFSFDGWRVSLDHTGGDLNARNATFLQQHTFNETNKWANDANLHSIVLFRREEERRSKSTSFMTILFY